MQSFKNYIKEGYREQHAAMSGYQLKKPTTTFMFNIAGNKKPLYKNGVIITRNAHSPLQAIRYLKMALPEFQYEDIEARPYTSTEKPTPPQPSKSIPKPEQMSLNI